jgi:hypothetical protein
MKDWRREESPDMRVPATSLPLQLLTEISCRAFLIEEQKIVKRVLHDQQKKAKK